MNIPENKYLGVLCKRGHDWQGTGKSLRYEKSHGCYECIKVKGFEYNQTNKIEKKEYKKYYRQTHKVKIKNYLKNYCQINKARLKEKKREYYKIHKTEILKHKEEYHRTHKLETKKYRQTHKNERNKYSRIRRKIDPMARLSQSISRMIRKSLNGNKKGQHWEVVVGYTLEKLKTHLEKQFKPGMTWGNRGKWEIDHIIPKTAFNFSSPEHLDFKKCWSLDNLQPLWKAENRNKSNKLKEAFQPSFKLEI